MPSSRVAIFANPIAGRGRGRTVAQRLADTLRLQGFDPTVIFDRCDAAVLPPLSRDDTVITIGGDGTLRGVVGRVCQEVDQGRLPADELPAFCVIPTGTANLMGRHLGIDWDLTDYHAKVPLALRTRRTVRRDAARANGELFLLMTGIGLDGQIIHELAKRRTGPIDLTSYVVPAAITFSSYPYAPITVTVDGQTVFGPTRGVAFVGNIRDYGTGFPILPDARPDDGLLDICALACENYADTAHLLLYAAAGEHLLVEGVVTARGKHVAITADTPIPIQADGEAAGFTPVNIDLLPYPLRFIVPPGI